MSKELKVKKSSILDNPIMFSFISIILGLLVGAVVLLIAGQNPVEAYTEMINGIIGKPKYIGWVIIRATPLILTGLSIAFAFKTGLFNIGAEGQYIIGSLVAAIVGINLDLPTFLLIPITLIAAAIGGAIWGGIVGYLKAKFGINEVIAAIMFNWIAFYFSNYMIRRPLLFLENSEVSRDISQNASLKIDWLTNIFGPATPINWGIVITIIIVIIISIILYKTTLGFELRAVGANRFGAEYAGINVNSSMIKSMAIAGLLSGLAGAIQVMGVTHNITILPMTEGYGFDGIAVALIANNNPIGIIFSGLLFGGLKYGGTKMQMIGAPSEVINIVIGSIVYFIALSSALRIGFMKFKNRKKQGGNI